MSTYVEQSLAPGETVRYSAALSLWGYFFNFLIGAVLLALSLWALFESFNVSPTFHHALMVSSLVAICVSLGVLLAPLISRKSTELSVTDRRVIAKFGLVSTHSIEIRLDKVESVRVQQGLTGKIFNFGDIMITGTGTTFDPIPKIARPLAFRNALNEAMERHTGAPLTTPR